MASNSEVSRPASVFVDGKKSGQLFLSKPICSSFDSDLVSDIEKRLDVRGAKALVFSDRKDDRNISVLAANQDRLSLGFIENLVQPLLRLRLGNAPHGYALFRR